MPRTRLLAGPLAALLLTATTLAGCGSDGAPAPLPGPGSGSPEDRLEAIARRALDRDVSADPLAAQVGWRVSGPRTVGIDVRLDPSEGDDGDLVRLTKGPATPVYPCPAPERCEVTETAAGTRVVAWDLVEPEEDPGFVFVALHGPDDTRTILLAGPDITADPRTTDLEHVGSVGAMSEVLSDPAYDDVAVAAAGAPVRWTPRDLAAVVTARLSATHGFHEVPGGVGFSAYGPAVSLTFLTGEGAGTACPTGYDCVTDGDLTRGWARGRAVLLRQRDGFVVRVEVRRLRLVLTGPDDFADDETLRALVVLSGDPEVAPELSSDWAAYTDEVDWDGTR